MRPLLFALFVTLIAPVSRAEDMAGRFDYYILALSWSPNWCAREGDARGSPQCDAGTGFGWILHGLWPQFLSGWPEYCATEHHAPPPELVIRMTEIMPSVSLVNHQWRKHGTCDGRTPLLYFADARHAFASVKMPTILRRHRETITVSAAQVEDAFLADNPALGRDSVTVTCLGGAIQDVRICLDRETLLPRSCTGRAARDCMLDRATFAPVR